MSRRKKLLLTISGGVILLAVVGAWALLQVSRARCLALVGEAICRVETSERLVALTFDDGPTREGVELAARALRENGAQATFFLIGSEVAGREALVRRLQAEGHEIGNHSYSHKRMTFRWPAFYEEEVMRADAALRAAGVPAPTLFRPPYGKKLAGLPNALARHDYRLIMWDVEDPPGAGDARAYADRVLSQVRPGSIILMHVMYRPNGIARDALPLILQGLRDRDYRVVTVGELLRRHR